MAKKSKTTITGEIDVAREMRRYSRERALRDGSYWSLYERKVPAKRGKGCAYNRAAMKRADF